MAINGASVHFVSRILANHAPSRIKRTGGICVDSPALSVGRRQGISSGSNSPFDLLIYVLIALQYVFGVIVARSGIGGGGNGVAKHFAPVAIFCFS